MLHENRHDADPAYQDVTPDSEARMQEGLALVLGPLLAVLAHGHGSVLIEIADYQVVAVDEHKRRQHRRTPRRS